MNRLLQLTLATSLVLSTAALAQAAEINLTVDDIRVTQGSISIAVYDTEQNYNGGEAVAVKTIPAAANSIEINFPELVDGQYAIKLLHDENDNGKLDTNFVGIPTEGYGFSNNGGRFGPASYADAKFDVTGTTELTINIR